MKSKYFSVPYGNVGLTAFKNQAGLMAALVSATSQNKSLENAVKKSTGNMTKVQKKAGNVASPAELRKPCWQMLKANLPLRLFNLHSKTRRWNLFRKSMNPSSDFRPQNNLERSKRGNTNCYQRDERPDKTTETKQQRQGKQRKRYCIT